MNKFSYSYADESERTNATAIPPLTLPGKPTLSYDSSVRRRIPIRKKSKLLVTKPR